MSSSTGSSQVSWLRQSIWIIFLPSGTNGETNPKGWYIELISESISHFCGAYPWSLHQNPTCLFLHSNVYHKCFLLTRFPGLVPDLQDPSISSLQGWIPQHLCNCSHTLWAELSYCTNCSYIFHQFDCCLLMLNWFEIINIKIFPKCVCYFFTIYTSVHHLLLFFAVCSYYNLVTKFPQRCKHSCGSPEVVHWHLHSSTKKMSWWAPNNW